MNVEILFAALFMAAVIGLISFESFYQWVYRFPDRTERQVIPYLREVNLEELIDLLSLAQEGYLRLNLSEDEFRREQRHRIDLTLEYYGRMSHNALLLQEWANNELRKSWRTFNREAASASRELNNACIEFRVHALITRMKLHAWLFRIKALPFVSIPFLAEARRIDSFDLVYTYERIKHAAEKLSRSCGSSYQDKLAQGM
ncbi:MAG: hypothetical protein WA738_13325 [Candidatus Angelobacter sp.]